ncbi:hypothetical protein DFQ14_103336 [Halopolyspora algeriensis]|uniref:Lipoprotein LprG n=1 Tax=Halopolyspora algeriensis TaxID=1500506 RepID=A0A368VUD6_9ACTN|nr:hypothetical protein [Halopolyspora algeriensis]RCW45365.1 hypothetical protein DFQ14_103336 [Halopolyspora algeriensis]TQM47405.1 hypothetical protein FHU43_3390 [Halopolyspora algeriensis]
MRRTAIALSATALVAALSACGGQGEETTQSAGDQHSGRASVTPVSNISALVSQANGSMDDKQTVTLNIDVSGGMPATARMGEQECQLDTAKSMMSCDGVTPMVMTKKAMYIKKPEAMSGSQGKPWAKMTFDANGMLGQSMAKMGKFRKFSDLEAMLPPGSTIIKTAKDNVDGKPAVRYEVTTDLTKAVEQGNEIAKSSRQMLVKQGITEIDQTIWIGPDELPLKVEAVTPSMTVMNQQVPETTTTVTYSDWGKPVDITVPPASEVSEMEMPQIPGMPQPPQ